MWDYFGFRIREHREACHLFLNAGFDGVQYMLDRLFVQRHRWTVDGLGTAGVACDGTSATGIFRRHADDDVHGLLGEKLTCSGFVLPPTFVLAAAIDSLGRADFVLWIYDESRRCGCIAVLGARRCGCIAVLEASPILCGGDSDDEVHLADPSMMWHYLIPALRLEGPRASLLVPGRLSEGQV